MQRKISQNSFYEYELKDERVYEYMIINNKRDEMTYWGVFALSTFKINFKSMIGNKSFERCASWLRENNPEEFL